LSDPNQKQSGDSDVIFPRIAVKSRPGNVVVRETETVLGEKVTHRTEEIHDPITGYPRIQTIEYVEKVIEKEVSKLLKVFFVVVKACTFPVLICSLSLAYQMFVSCKGATNIFLYPLVCVCLLLPFIVFVHFSFWNRTIDIFCTLSRWVVGYIFCFTSSMRLCRRYIDGLIYKLPVLYKTGSFHRKDFGISGILD
jgi:hypothetical protein